MLYDAHLTQRILGFLIPLLCLAQKNSLSQLLRIIRSAPQVTAECLHQQEGELLLLQTIQTHTTHAVLLCYGCVLMRKLCHLSIESTDLFVRHGIVAILIDALYRFPEDAILQASACGCLAVLAQSSNASKNLMLQSHSDGRNVVQLVLHSLGVHCEYSNLTRQVQIYACEGRTLCVIMLGDANTIHSYPSCSWQC